MNLMKTYKMQNPVSFGHINLYSAAQQAVLGAQVAAAISEGRDIEIRQQDKSILLLLSAADDLGKVFLIGPRGRVQEVGDTEAI